MGENETSFRFGLKMLADLFDKRNKQRTFVKWAKRKMFANWNQIQVNINNFENESY